MDIRFLISSITEENILRILFKFINISFSLFYLLYAIVIERQTMVMNKALNTPNNRLILSISFLQIVIGAILVFLAIFIF